MRCRVASANLQLRGDKVRRARATADLLPRAGQITSRKIKLFCKSILREATSEHDVAAREAVEEAAGGWTSCLTAKGGGRCLA